MLHITVLLSCGLAAVSMASENGSHKNQHCITCHSKAKEFQNFPRHQLRLKIREQLQQAKKLHADRESQNKYRDLVKKILREDVNNILEK